MAEKIYPFVLEVNSPIERGAYISKISQAFGVSRGDVERELEIVKKQNILKEKEGAIRALKKSPHIDIFQKDTIIEKTKKKILRELTAIYYWQKNLTKTKPWVKPESILNIIRKNSTVELYEAILALEKKQENYIQSLIFETEELYDKKDQNALKYDLEEMENRLRQESLKEEILKLQKELDLASDSERIKILKKIQKLTKEKDAS
jgi:hypothetical protein